MTETNDQRPTLRTLAQMTGLGVSTVSQALRNNPEIAEETRKRVQLAAKQAGYRPNRAGVRLRTGKSNVIALILNAQDGGTGFFSNIVYGISDALAGSSYHLVVTPYSLSDPMEPVRYVVETNSADGVILSRTQPDDPRIRYLTENNFPFATHGRTEMGIDHAFYDFDNEAYTHNAAQILAAKNRQNLVLVCPPSSLTYFQHALSGFNRAISDLGVTGTILSNIDTDSDLNDVTATISKLAQGKNRPDGFICTASSIAMAVIHGMETNGYKIGADFDVVTKSLPPFLQMLRPEIISINEDFRNAGLELGRMLIARIAGIAPETLQILDRPQ